jgi:hypothetical protein
MFDDKVKAFFTTKTDGNIAFHVVDEDKHDEVISNRNKLSDTYNIDISNLKYMDQIHGDDIVVVSKDSKYTCDALITNKKNTPLMIMSADCIGILFYDPTKLVIGVAHAGRNSTFLQISMKTIKLMQKEYGSNPKDIKVNMGPSIQKCCYEVSQEMADIVSNNFGDEFVDGRYIDLQGINKKQLLNLNLKEQNISISNICTKCSTKDYFSYREDKNCGRFAGVISIV